MYTRTHMYVCYDVLKSKLLFFKETNLYSDVK